MKSGGHGLRPSRWFWDASALEDRGPVHSGRCGGGGEDNAVGTGPFADHAGFKNLNAVADLPASQLIRGRERFEDACLVLDAPRAACLAGDDGADWKDRSGCHGGWKREGPVRRVPAVAEQ